MRGPRRFARRLWAMARFVGVLATGALLAALVIRPEVGLTALWKVAVPQIPASLLISPLVWRNVCPLATISMAGGRLRRGGSLPARAAYLAIPVGIVLLVALVPARRFLFDHHGLALAIAIGGVAGLALALGAVFDAKGGFCNAICPVLPVERLYGQSPVVEVPNARCETCSACAPGCLDLSPRRALDRVLGPPRDGRSWTFTPYGAFAAAFPGFVIGYFISVGGTLAAAPWVYLQVVATAAASWVVVTVIVGMGRIPAARALPALAAGAAGAYYAFAVPDSTAALGIDSRIGEVVRVAALGGVLWWWVLADRHRGPAGGVLPHAGTR